MQRFLLALVIIAGLVAPLQAAPAPTQVCFTPGGDCTLMIVQFIRSARSQVLMQAYTFTSAPIARALTEARQRGVDVRVILDRSQVTEKYSSADYLAHAGIPVLIDRQHAIAHNKVIVVDRVAVETGSFNFTKAAQNSNAENALILQDPALAAQYAANWQEHAGHSEPYAGR